MKDIDILINDINAMYDKAEPGARAKVEQLSASVRDHLARSRDPITAMQVRAYIVSVMLAGMTAGVGPEPTKAADVLGLRVAGACLLYRTLQTDR